MRKKRKIVERNFYSEYPYNQPNSSNYVTEEDYKKIITTFFNNLVEHMVVTGDHYKAPSGMGSFYVKKFRASKSKLNYQAWKQGKYQLHTNFHTFGYSVGLVWEKPKARIKYLRMYKFTAVRGKARYISKENQINNHVYKYTG